MNIQIWHSDYSLPVGYFHVADANGAAEQVEICGELPCGALESITIWF